MRPIKSITRWIGLVLILLTQACGSSQSEPLPVPPTSIESYLTPLATPTIAATLPPLPDFSKHLYFTFGGGGDGTCDGWAGVDYFSQRGGNLCVNHFPVGMDFHITLTSPDGKTSLEGDFKATDSADGLIWVGHENEENNTGIEYYSNNDNTIADVRLHLWWAGNLPTGDWKSQITWDGNETNDIFKVSASQGPEIYLVDAQSDTDLLLSSALYRACRLVQDSKNISIGGNNFPPEKIAYLLVYQIIPEDGLLTEKVEQMAILADQSGRFEAALTETLYHGSEYFVIAGTSPDFVESNVEESMYTGSAIDCFEVP